MADLKIFSDFMSLIATNWPTILLAFCVFLLWKFKNSRYYAFYTRRLPPGPTMIPLIGYLPGMGTISAPWWAEQSKKYKSKVVSLRVFGGVAVVINDYDLIKEYFARSSMLSDRQSSFFTTICDPNYRGIISTSGRDWAAHRRFTMRLMKDLGMGKLTGEQNICDESEKAIQAFKEEGKGGVAFDPFKIINMAVSNIINSIVFGKQFQYDDQRFTDALQAMNEWFHDILNPINMFLYTRPGKLLMKDLMAKLMDLYGKYKNFVVEEIEEHKKNFDGEGGDMINAYLMEMKTTEEKDIFNDDQLTYLIMDLFMAGSETTYSSLRWFLLYMAAYPDVQEKVYDELRSVMSDRYPSMQDKKNTPYTNAVICEIQRCSTLTPMTLAHGNLNEEIEVEGYHLPPDTPVFGNIDQVHHDPRFWKNPDEFDPSNFLDEDGNMLNTEKLIPFSMGRRSCAGEALARMELYIFFTSWIKTFQIKPETDDTKPEIKFNADGLNVPKPFKLRMIPRD